MKQTAATFVVQDGVIMADQDQCISIHQARVIVEPLDQPSTVDLEQRANAAFTRMDRAATRLMKWVVVAFALYFASILVHAFVSGAFSTAVK